MAPVGVLRDAIGNIGKLWRNLSPLGNDGSRPPEVSPELPPADAQKVRRLIAECLAARGGEVSARARAAVIGRLYLRLDASGRRRFLQILARDFSADRGLICQAASALCEAREEADFVRAEAELREILVSPRLRLLSHFNALPQGVKFLIDLRAELLELSGDDPTLANLDGELRRLLATWFDIGLLELRRISWESPAALLEKLITYEAVHEINSWQDLRNRLESDRRCYAFFHPAMPDEPLIFIEVALVRGLSASVQELLDPQAPLMAAEDADTAIFYSISNTQKGLRGISFGHFLIKQVVDDLRRQLPGLKTFATLSPIPGFSRWLQAIVKAESDEPLEERMRQALSDVAEHLRLPPLLEDICANPQSWRDPQVEQWLREPLELLCLRYFHERDAKGGLLDPVERFHLGNGARIERINWLGDISAKGMRQSCGLMVNYNYKIDEIEKNHEGFATDGEIALAKSLRKLWKAG